MEIILKPGDIPKKNHETENYGNLIKEGYSCYCYKLSSSAEVLDDDNILAQNDTVWSEGRPLFI